jgi:hypothetical protein
VYQTATAVIGRPFGTPEADVAEHWWTLENPANHWFGVGSVARMSLPAGTDGAGAGDVAVALGVAEVVTPDLTPSESRPAVKDLLTWLARAGVTATCSRSSGTRYGSVDLDSNLPDFRIALGGPSVNAFTAEVLSASDPSVAKRLAQLVAEGGAARLWVPACRSRRAAFEPGADLRGPRDLPVLIVATADPASLDEAVGELARDVMSQRIPAEVCEGKAIADGDAPLAEGAVAVFNKGTLGAAVTPDGTLWMSLFRACSGWPSGVWIDGDRRTAPDGSSFAWQHWSHTFSYALASAGGHADWRSAGFNAAAEDYNHDLFAVVTEAAGALDGAAAGGAGLGGAPNVTLAALKPVGNPLAAGRPGTPSRTPREVTVRLRETDGRTAVARLRLAAGIEAAWRSDLLEEKYGADLPPADGAEGVGTIEVTDGTARVPLGPFETATLRVRLAEGAVAGVSGGAAGAEAGAADGAAGAAAGPGAVTAGPPEPGQPVYTRYWLHGKGPAPAGNVPVAVHFSPTRVTLASAAGEGGADSEGGGDSEGGADGEGGGEAAARLTLTVACGPAGGSGQVELVVPDGLAAQVAGVGDAGAPLGYELEPNGFAAWDVAVRALPGTPGGRYFLTARITDGLGQVLEDAALVTIGELGPADPDLEAEELFFRLHADVTALAAEADLELGTAAVRLAPGESGELAVRIGSHLASQLRGEVQLVSPVGTWQATGPWTQPVTVPPGGDATVRFAVTVPATAVPGWESWLLVKLMYFGRVRYSEAVPLTVS